MIDWLIDKAVRRRWWVITLAVAWAADNRTLFYTTTDAAKRPYRLYRHTLDCVRCAP